MNIFWNLLSLTFPVMLTVIPLAFYKMGGHKMARFYFSMLSRKSTRKVYVQVLLFFLLIFHYIFTCTHVGEYGVLLSTILIASLYRFKFADWLLNLLCGNSKTFMITALVVVAIAPIPHLYTTSVTVAFLLLASMFYPSWHAVEDFVDGELTEPLSHDIKKLITLYYSNISSGCQEDVDTGNDIQST